MSNEYYVSTGAPATRSQGNSAPMRAQFSNIELGFNKLPNLSGFANRMVKVNASATGMSSDTLLTDNGTDLTSTGELKFSKVGQFLSRTGSSTSAQYINITNTTGGMIMGVEASAAGTMITGDSGYEGIIRAKVGFSLSANDGATAHLRIRSTGHVGLFGTNPTGFGNGWYSIQMPNGCATMVHNAIPEINIIANGYYNGANWIYSTTAPMAILKVTGSGTAQTLDFQTAASGSAGATATLASVFKINGNGGVLTIPGVNSNTSVNAANVYVDGSGNIVRSTSSRRRKAEIQPIEVSKARDIIMRSLGVTFKSTCESDDPDQLHYGFIAEDMEQVEPAMLHWEYDQHGNKIPGGVQYERMTAPLTVLAQDHEQRISALEAQ